MNDDPGCIDSIAAGFAHSPVPKKESTMTSPRATLAHSLPPPQPSKTSFLPLPLGTITTRIRTHKIKSLASDAHKMMSLVQNRLATQHTQRRICPPPPTGVDLDGEGHA